MRKRNLFLFLLSLFISPAFSQKNGKQLNKTLDKLITQTYTSISPGCVVLVAKKGQVIYNKAFGTANIELDVPMRPEMIFRIGSMTKQYTAIAILQLVEQEKISLQDSIQKFVKDFPYKEHAITIENLLTHTSGIVDYEALDFHIRNAIRIDFPPKQLIDSVAKLPLEFAPSTKYNYSNTNYLLLGYIIEKVSGKSYKDYLQQNIFKPAGLSNTYYDSPTQIIRNRADGYAKDGSLYRNADYISMEQVFSAGALMSNAEDLFEWHQALYSYKLIKKETLDKAVTPYKLADGKATEYGYGWFIKNWNNKKTVGHGGAIDGFRSMEIYVPEQDIFITVLFNSDDDNFFKLFESILEVVAGKLSEGASKEIKIEQAVLDSYVGKYRPIEDSTEFFRIYKEKGKLYMDLSNETGMHMELIAQSQTLFSIPVIKRVPTTVEFIMQNGKVKGLYWTQEAKHETIKIE